jgi:flagellar assembly protein FliH
MTSSSKPGGRPPFPNVPPPLGSKPTSSYARFIPREELGAFAAWKPGSLGGEGAVTDRRAQPRPENAPEPTADEWRAQIAAARQAGYQDGYRDGLVALDGFKQAFAAQMSAQVGHLITNFDAQLGALEQQMAQAVAQSAVLLARQVIRHELETRPEHVVPLAQEAVNTVLMSARHIVVRVHPDDHALVADGASEALMARGARLLADATVQRGGCTIDSDVGAIDASIETRWSQAAATLGGDAAWDDAFTGAVADPAARRESAE